MKYSFMSFLDGSTIERKGSISESGKKDKNNLMHDIARVGYCLTVRTANS